MSQDYSCSSSPYELILEASSVSQGGQEVIFVIRQTNHVNEHQSACWGALQGRLQQVSFLTGGWGRGGLGDSNMCGAVIEGGLPGLTTRTYRYPCNLKQQIFLTCPPNASPSNAVRLSMLC